MPEKDMRAFINNLSSGKDAENWITVGGQSPKRTSPITRVDTGKTVVSPNGFQLLQHIHEDGEIVEDGESPKEPGLIPKPPATLEGLDENEENKKLGTTAGQRGKAKNRPVFANSKGLVQAVVSGQTKESFLSEE